MLLGYAAGVGKTYRMLEEGLELKASGVDVVIGYFEPHGRKDTIAKTEGLELDSAPPHRVPRNGFRRNGHRRDSGAPASSLPGG